MTPDWRTGSRPPAPPRANATDERTQVSNALTANSTNIATNLTDIAALTSRSDDLESGVNGTPPTSLVGRVTANADLDASVHLSPHAIATATAPTNDVWVTVLEESSAAGIIEFLSLYQVANVSDRITQGRLSIDGVVVWLSDSNCWQTGSGDNNFGVWLIGGQYAGEYQFSNIPFSASFKLEFQKTGGAGSVEMGSGYLYHLTG